MPPHLAAYEPYDEQAQDEPLFEQLHIVSISDWPDLDSSRWRFDTCKLEQCLITNQDVTNITIWDSILVRCDISACRLFDAGLLRSELLGCRAVGLQLGESTIKDVSFKNCKLSMASFRKCTLMRVTFENCILDDTDFNNATLSDVSFIKCELNRTDFSGIKAAKVDMTNSDIRQIRGVRSLKNVRVSAEQVLDLAPLLAAEVGLVVL